jgi:hypothetical protein
MLVVGVGYVVVVVGSVVVVVGSVVVVVVVLVVVVGSVVVVLVVGGAVELVVVLDVDVVVVVLGPDVVVEDGVVLEVVTEDDVVVVVGTSVVDVLVAVVVLVRAVVVVGTLVVVDVVGGGHAPKRGAHARMKRSRSVPRGPRADTRMASLPGRCRSNGPFTGTMTSPKGPQAGPTRDGGAGTRSSRTLRTWSACGGRHRPTPSSLMHTRAANLQVPSQSPS